MHQKEKIALEIAAKIARLARLYWASCKKSLEPTDFIQY
jgi:hypothetical protein